jgi:hypothetical protein
MFKEKAYRILSVLTFGLGLYSLLAFLIFILYEAYFVEIHILSRFGNLGVVSSFLIIFIGIFFPSREKPYKTLTTLGLVFAVLFLSYFFSGLVISG